MEQDGTEVDEDIFEEDTPKKRDDYIQDGLAMRKWETEPEAKDKWDDITKDNVLGNLEKYELGSILMGEEFMTSLEALRSLLPSKIVSDYYFPDSMSNSILRKKASLLALSNSKDGFLRRLNVTKILSQRQDLIQSLKNEQKKMGILGFLRNRRKG